MKKSKAFTLIELIGVLVIMAIIALIVTPLVMN
ncbi:MAG: prepilin-type N-terminal cleavage/methylation domain-containing protein, partial [Bacilli bacterium]|nr:prepilin-type N-terminal cleavage/methylation domain-containing protein [Bacilli bacterium]